MIVPKTASAVGAVLSRHSWSLSLALAAALAITVITWNLGSAPAGPTIDELSIGQNAWHLATTGKDEHGVHWPVYFRAFSWGNVGENKNPVYVYALAPFERLWGPGNAVLRIPAVLFALLLAISLGLGVWELSRQGLIDLRPEGARWVALLTALAAIVTPWCFHFGRIGLEAITFPSLLSLSLYLTLLTRRRPSALPAFLAGMGWGITAYAYSTARLLVPILLLLLLVANARWTVRHPWVAVVFVVGLLVSATPVIRQVGKDPGGLTAKYYASTICPRPPANASQLASCLSQPAQRAQLRDRYLDYLSLRFLFRSGDPNSLHAMPHHGLLHLYWLPLLVLGVAGIAARWRHPFTWVLALAILIAPLAASTMREPLHSIRSISMLPFLLLLGGVGLSVGVRALEQASSAERRIIAASFGVLVLLETTAYVRAYHSDYRRLLFQQHPHVALAEAIRVASIVRHPEGHVFLPLEMVQNPRTGQSRLEGHVSVFWRYYLRVKGPWSAPNGPAAGIRGGQPTEATPRGSVLITHAAAQGPQPCARAVGGFFLLTMIATPPPQPVPKLCVFFKPWWSADGP